MEDRFKKTKSFKKQNKTTTGKLRKKSMTTGWVRDFFTFKIKRFLRVGKKNNCYKNNI